MHIQDNYPLERLNSNTVLSLARALSLFPTLSRSLAHTLLVHAHVCTSTHTTTPLHPHCTPLALRTPHHPHHPRHPLTTRHALENPLKIGAYVDVSPPCATDKCMMRRDDGIWVEDKACCAPTQYV